MRLLTNDAIRILAGNAIMIIKLEVVVAVVSVVVAVVGDVVAIVVVVCCLLLLMCNFFRFRFLSCF